LGKFVTQAKVIGRFAPSPTGVLHLGNLRTGLASWLSVKIRGGRWLIRIEDVDIARSQRAIADQQLRDLARLGLESDEAVLWQSQRGEAYREALNRLHERHALYPCHCTRKDLQLLSSAPHESDDLRPYSGTCRDRHWEGFDRALRFRLSEGEVEWRDHVLGLQRGDPNALTGDPLLFRRDGCFAYHLAVVVDDGAQGVTEVVRGADLKGVTPTQIRLQQALSLKTPNYAHLNLVRAPDGSRLGKRNGALGIDALLAKGVSTEQIVGWLGWSLGCLEKPEACSAESLLARFDWRQVSQEKIAVPSNWI
jgi:glutamyl-queuosine tRNA(Asp) synthetase